ncbi:MAG: DUF1003 domain-containing protein [Flavisolibacter sp.]
MRFKRIEKIRTWYERKEAEDSFGDRLADYVANGMGSWTFIIAQTLIVAGWMVLNFVAFINHWDPYPFILLNLLFSTQAAYSAPIIMMSQNRQSERDRAKAMADYENNIASKEGIESMLSHLDGKQAAKLDRMLELLEKWDAERKVKELQ